MEVFLFRPDQYERHYGCSAYSVEDIPLEQRQHRLLGLFFVAVTLLYQVLYVPCLVSIWRRMSDNHCLKVMFCVGLVDMLTLPMNGTITGYFAFTGAVFCSFPRLIYVLGAWGLGCWCVGSSLEIVLAWNRCVELWSPEVANRVYGGNKLWLWLGVPIAYGLCIGVWTNTLAFSALYSSWFFNPHVGYIEDGGLKYANAFHTFHNNAFLCALFLFYGTFCVIFFFKSLANPRPIGEQNRIYVQVFLTTSVNAIAASCYVYMQYNEASPFLIFLGQFCWVNSHGMKPVIYLLTNKAIRQDCGAMLRKRKTVEEKDKKLD